MLKCERTAVMNLENALRGMRNPMNSWAKSDSYTDGDGNFVVGEGDLDLAVRLAKSGTDHRKYLRMIFVSVDVTAPLYWWKEYDTYKVGRSPTRPRRCTGSTPSPSAGRISAATG